MPVWYLAVVLANGEPSIIFNRDVRPILAENCFKCHGPDSRQRQADLRLDIEADAKKKLPSEEFAIVAGDLSKSGIIARIHESDADLKMPPPKSGKTLTAKEIAVLEQWIKQGANWQGHWAYLPIIKPVPPARPNDQLVQSPIDAFVAAEWDKRGLKPAKEADRATLLRRLHFDLIGLPPKPDDVKAFVNDGDPLAYEKWVDRLLDSPHFGERLAMFWLDLVRYADSVGYHGDQDVSVSPYRDYVIKSFNENKPFDQFTIEQLAGDLLPKPNTQQRIASAYNRLGMMSAEGGAQEKEYLSKYAAERVRNIGGAWLGSTLGCCECHDHKYDPISTRDFYRMEAFFADIKERGVYLGANDDGRWGPHMQVPTPPQEKRKTELTASINQVQAKYDESPPELLAEYQQWVDAQRRPDWKSFSIVEAKSTGGAKLTTLPDGSILASGNNSATDTYTITAKLPIQKISAIRLEALPDNSLPGKGPGRAGNGNFVVTEIQVDVQRSKTGRKQRLTFDRASASFEQTQAVDRKKHPYKKWAAAAAIDDDAKGKTWGWGILGETGQSNEAVFATVVDADAGAEALWTVTIHQNLDNPGHNLGRFRLSATDHPRPLNALGSGMPRNVRDALAVASKDRSKDHQAALLGYFKTITPRLKAVRAELARLNKSLADLNRQITTVLITETVPPRTIRVLPRGNWMDETGEVVSPGFPAVLASSSDDKNRLNRLDLARWVVSKENPLTARVFVNRLWKIYFGAGLSTKLDDFGAQGDPPSHPELLDWLAATFIESGWNVKETIRAIVTSRVYRLSSSVSTAERERDSTNRWLTRQASFRLDAELVRDNALAVSGLLVPDVGGKSVKPYQPPGYWAYLNFPKREWQNDTGGELYRRGLYTHWQRQYLHPSLAAFDAPCREECAAERGRSNTPLQSLVLLNDPIYVEAARAFAERCIKEGGKDQSDRLRWAFMTSLSRPPREAETRILTDMYLSHLKEYRKDSVAAKALVNVGAKPVPKDMDVAELAAWTSVTRTIINLHAFVTRN